MILKERSCCEVVWVGDGGHDPDWPSWRLGGSKEAPFCWTGRLGICSSSRHSSQDEGQMVGSLLLLVVLNDDLLGRR